MKKILYIMCGLPGSGKTTLAHKKFGKNSIIVSSDDVREQLFGDASNQSSPALVFAEVHKQIHEAFKTHKKVVYDATNLTPKIRKNIIKEFPEVDKFIAVLVATPVLKCEEQNTKRERQVPNQVIERMAKRFVYPQKEEGFNSVIKI